MGQEPGRDNDPSRTVGPESQRRIGECRAGPGGERDPRAGPPGAGPQGRGDRGGPRVGRAARGSDPAPG